MASYRVCNSTIFVEILRVRATRDYFDNPFEHIHWDFPPQRSRDSPCPLKKKKIDDGTSDHEEEEVLRLIVMIFWRFRGRIFSSDSMFNQSRSPRTKFGIVEVLKKSKEKSFDGRNELVVGAVTIGVGSAENEEKSSRKENVSIQPVTIGSSLGNFTTNGAETSTIFGGIDSEEEDEGGRGGAGTDGGFVDCCFDGYWR